MTRSAVLLVASIALAHGLNAQAASGPRVALAPIAPDRVGVGRSAREARVPLSLNWNPSLIDSAGTREAKKTSDASLLGALIGAVVGAVSFRLLADDHVDHPGNYAVAGAVLIGGLGLLIGLSWKSMHQ